MTIKELDKGNCIEILTKLVKCNTTNPPGNEADIINVIQELLKVDSKMLKVFSHGDNRASLIATIQGHNLELPEISFVGHVDTVCVEDIEQWSVDPFGAQVVDDIMYGRGTADMKGGVTTMILTANYIIEQGLIPEQTINFIFTADEEIDGMGITTIVDSGALDKTGSPQAIWEVMPELIKIYLHRT